MIVVSCILIWPTICFTTGSLGKISQDLAHIWVCNAKAWARLEHEDGRIDEARRLFQLASAANPHDLYAWQVWRSTGM